MRNTYRLVNRSEQSKRYNRVVWTRDGDGVDSCKRSLKYTEYIWQGLSGWYDRPTQGKRLTLAVGGKKTDWQSKGDGASTNESNEWEKPKDLIQNTLN